MVINVIAPKKFSHRKLIYKSNIYYGNKQFLTRKKFFNSISLDYAISINRHSITISFQNNNYSTVDFLRDYILCVFGGETIGIDKENQITLNLSNVKVISLGEDFERCY